jgi:hypothetical protein
MTQFYFAAFYWGTEIRNQTLWESCPILDCFLSLFSSTFSKIFAIYLIGTLLYPVSIPPPSMMVLQHTPFWTIFKSDNGRGTWRVEGDQAIIFSQWYQSFVRLCLKFCVGTTHHCHVCLPGSQEPHQPWFGACPDFIQTCQALCNTLMFLLSPCWPILRFWCWIPAPAHYASSQFVHKGHTVTFYYQGNEPTGRTMYVAAERVNTNSLCSKISVCVCVCVWCWEIKFRTSHMASTPSTTQLYPPPTIFFI